MPYCLSYAGFVQGIRETYEDTRAAYSNSAHSLTCCSRGSQEHKGALHVKCAGCRCLRHSGMHINVKDTNPAVPPTRHRGEGMRESVFEAAQGLQVVPASTVPCPHSKKALLHRSIPAFALSSSLFSKLFSTHPLPYPSTSSLSSTLSGAGCQQGGEASRQHEWHRPGTCPRCCHHLLPCPQPHHAGLHILHLNRSSI